MSKLFPLLQTLPTTTFIFHDAIPYTWQRHIFFFPPAPNYRRTSGNCLGSFRQVNLLFPLDYNFDGSQCTTILPFILFLIFLMRPANGQYVTRNSCC